MQVKLTIGERLKDLRVERKLTLEQLSNEVGISKSALGKYESDNGKDISPYSILVLADYYGVSCDYLMGRTETKKHPNTALHELHLSDASIDVLRTGKFNHRLLSELICHKDFQRLMLDAEIYVDRIADMRIKDMNTVLEATRQMVLMEHGEEANDLYLHTLKAAQIQEEEYFGHLVTDDLSNILRDIREEHRTDALTADDDLSAAAVQKQLMEAVHFEGSSEEKKIRAYLATLGIDYDTLTKEEFVSLIGILKKSKHMKSPISQRGKTTMTHGKGKRKKTLKQRRRCGGTRAVYTFTSFSSQSDFASQKSCICAVTHVTKSACPTAAEKCLPTAICPRSRWRSQPLSRVSRKQRYNTLDFASKIVCQQGCYPPLLETQSQRGYAPLDTPPVHAVAIHPAPARWIRSCPNR